MARRSRRQPLAYEVAEGVTSLWLLWFGLTVFLPVFSFHGVPTAGNVRLLLLGAVPVALSWWWLVYTVRQQRARGKRLDELVAMSPTAFEEWVGARFRELGYSVQHTGTQGDHGIDLLCTRADELAVVQAKKYKDWSVGEPILRDIYGAMHAAGAHKAYLVTTGKLTAPARQWAHGKPIELWDGDRVAQISLGATAAPAQPQEAAAGECPRCGSPLVQRMNRRTRAPFLGCSTFPKCRFAATGA